MTEHWQRSAGELARLAATGGGDAVEIVESHLDRIAAANPALNAVVDVMADGARAEARTLDARSREGHSAGALHGVPVTVKEELNVAGSPTTCGVVGLRDHVPDVDSPAVARLRGAGCVVIGRTNQPDMGQRMHTDCDLYGPTVNPWDAAHTPGGSSGGDAVAVATGMTPLGLGTDMGGSVRIPAYCCGVTALKPSFGRVPRFGETTGMSIIVQLACVAGPLARRVADLRLALRVLEGTDPLDPDAVPSPPPVSHALRGLRVGLAEPDADSPWPSSVTTAMERAARALEDAGCSVVSARPPSVSAGLETFLKLALSTDSDREPPGLSYSPGVLRFWELVRAAAPQYTAADVGPALEERYEQACEWALFLQDHPLLLAPVWTCPPWPVGFDVSGREAAADVFWHDRYTLCVNLVGLPAVAVPTGVVDGLPSGVQLIAARFADDLCLTAAEAVEERLGSITPITPAFAAAAGKAPQ